VCVCVLGEGGGASISLVGDIHTVLWGPPTVAFTHGVCVCVCGYYSLCESKYMHVFESRITKSASFLIVSASDIVLNYSYS